MIDSPSKTSNKFELTNEFIERKNFDFGIEIVKKLKEHGIENEYEIAYNMDIQNIFKEISNTLTPSSNLQTLLNDFEIAVNDSLLSPKKLANYKIDREENLYEIVELLFTLAKSWSMHREIEDKIYNYNILENEQLLRPEEEKKLDTLGDNSAYSFDIISKLTETYIDLLADYYFKYGGDLILAEFVDEISKIKLNVAKKYSNLIQGQNPLEN